MIIEENVNKKVKMVIEDFADANFGEIRRQLFYKKDLYGNELNIVDGFYPSSKICSHCGAIRRELTFATRMYGCGTCGMAEDRDRNGQ